MSLVAYDASSDEESDFEGNEVDISTRVFKSKTIHLAQPVEVDASNDHISDEDDFISQFEDKQKNRNNKFSKFLPKPKKESNISAFSENFAKPTFAALPTPKTGTQVDVEEDDDEFLHKKENIDSKSSNEVKRMPVKITIPPLTHFQDVEKEIVEKALSRSAISNRSTSSSSGLLGILPKAKSEQCFVKETTLNNSNGTNANNAVHRVMPSFIPDSVKHRRPATNTEDVDSLKPYKKSFQNKTSAVQNDIMPDSDESDDDNAENGDFFSFNTDQSLPEVSASELNSLVAKKAAKIVEATSNFLKTREIQKDIQEGERDLESSRKRSHQELNSEAIQSLVGGSTKRQRQKQSKIQIIEINSSQVLPDKDEWMRTALASSTSYQPTGVLVDEEPACGTRRKHQITYLAHKAKANEAELQAMWSANRQNRRATQSKYGF